MAIKFKAAKAVNPSDLPCHLSQGLRIKLSDFGASGIKLDAKLQEAEELVAAHTRKVVKINLCLSQTFSYTMVDMPLLKMS